MKTFKVFPRERIQDYELTASEFFRTVLELEYRDCLVTDESQLVDFASCGMPETPDDRSTSLGALYEAWEAWIVPTIASRYGIGIASASISLIDLFERIEAARRRTLH